MNQRHLESFAKELKNAGVTSVSVAYMENTGEYPEDGRFTWEFERMNAPELETLEKIFHGIECKKEEKNPVVYFSQDVPSSSIEEEKVEKVAEVSKDEDKPVQAVKPAKKNLNNELVIQELVEQFENLTDENVEVEYRVGIKIVEERNNSFTMKCEVHANDKLVHDFYIGKNYNERGAYTKANQLIKLIECSRPLGKALGKKNNLKVWGYERVKGA
ncbi:hypothetical protein [Viridibacillus arvi]|uniref:hypothetical protein n=1 Tax=Viridibacillus arvi TaxID=263475 RepID=UPI0034CFC2E5